MAVVKRKSKSVFHGLICKLILVWRVKAEMSSEKSKSLKLETLFRYVIVNVNRIRFKISLVLKSILGLLYGWLMMIQEVMFWGYRSLASVFIFEVMKSRNRTRGWIETMAVGAMMLMRWRRCWIDVRLASRMILIKTNQWSKGECFGRWSISMFKQKKWKVKIWLSKARLKTIIFASWFDNCYL